MADHAWCHDIARDAAVRAAEDNRTGPLPTLAEAIDEQTKHAAMLAGIKDGFVRLDGLWKRMTDEELRKALEIPKSVFASSAPDHENKGDDMATKSEMQAADYRAEAIAVRERRSEQTKGDEMSQGLRKERVTLEITGAPGWKVNVTGSDVESVRVVDAHAEAVAESVAWEGARDAYRGRILRLTEERDAAIRARDEAIAESKRRLILCETMKRDGDSARFHAACASARVAELEAAAKLAPRANADGGSNHAKQAASGGGEGEPVAWMCEWTDHVGLHHTKADAEDEAAGDVVPQALYRAPPQPRGWLSGDERLALDAARTIIDGSGRTNIGVVIRDLLARSSPPEVDA